MLELPATRSFEAGLSSAAVPLTLLVVPVYKGERNIHPFLKRALAVLERLGSYQIIFCLDPSSEGTEAIICAEIERNPNIRLLFSRRCDGHGPQSLPLKTVLRLP